MPAGTQASWMLSSDYNVLRSTVVAMNNFIQCSLCQAAQPFPLTLFLIKVLTTSVSKHMGVRRGRQNGHFPPLEIVTKNQNFLENLKSAA